MTAALDTMGPMLAQEMRNKLAFAQSWSEEIAAPVVTTEAWGPWWHMDHPDLDWGWLRAWVRAVHDAGCPAQVLGRHALELLTPLLEELV